MTQQRSRPAVRWSRRHNPPGEVGLWRTVEVIRAGIRRESALPAVRAAAALAVRGCGPTDTVCRARGIQDYVARVMQYVPDPVGVEAVALASSHLANLERHGHTWGDCDDATALIGTLAHAVGLPVRVTVASFRPDRFYHHVWPEILAGMRWLDLDIFRSERFAGRATRVRHVLV